MSGKKMMLIDLNSCGGCHACSVSCKAEHRAAQDYFRHRVQVVDKGAYPSVSRSFIPTLCQHCTDAPCISSCPVEAIQRTEEGIVFIDDETCVGSGTCVSACPYGAIYMDPHNQFAMKCDFCQDRLTKGDSPACVSTCPTDAIVFGSEEDEEIRVRLQSGNYTSWEPAGGTKPRVLYSGLEQDVKQALTKINGNKWSMGQ